MAHIQKRRLAMGSVIVVNGEELVIQQTPINRGVNLFSVVDQRYRFPQDVYPNADDDVHTIDEEYLEVCIGRYLMN
jgi:hypothetical protein